MKWNDVSYLLGSPTSLKILKCLDAESPLALLQIAKEIDVAQSNVSTKLGHMAKRKLVECINPDAHKWRLYKISKKGRIVLKETKKIGKGRAARVTGLVGIIAVFSGLFLNLIANPTVYPLLDAMFATGAVTSMGSLAFIGK